VNARSWNGQVMNGPVANRPFFFGLYWNENVLIQNRMSVRHASRTAACASGSCSHWSRRERRNLQVLDVVPGDALVVVGDAEHGLPG
jgi:hypothetical protein